MALLDAVRLATELQAAGRAAEAAAQFAFALEHHSADVPAEARADLYSDYGIALNQAGQRESAFRAYEQCLTLRPSHGRAYNNLAVARQAHGDVDAALSAYAHAVRLLPATPVLPLNAMRCMLDGARWRGWALLEWLARRDASEPPSSSPWARLEARAFLVDSAARLHTAAAAEAAAVEAAAAAEWACDAGCEGAPMRVPRLRARQPLRVALLSDLDADPSASLLTHVLPALHGSGGVEVTLLALSARAPSAHLQRIARAVPTRWLPAAPPSLDEGGTRAELCDAHAALRELRPHIVLEAMGMP
jgi:hypothetical protein